MHPSELGLDIITCPQWGARKPKQGLETISPSKNFVCHGTDGHVRQLGDPKITTREEAMQYARDIQHLHMDIRGWNDSGHNFLVCKSGWVLQGRWLTVSAIQARHMVRSAHAGDNIGNEQIGIEFEHLGTEPMVPLQRRMGAKLMAWVSLEYGHSFSLPMFPHNKYFNTSCPVNLENEIPRLVAMASQTMVEPFLRGA